MTNATATTPTTLTIDFSRDGFACRLQFEVDARTMPQRLDQAVQLITAAGGQPLTSGAAPAGVAQQAAPVGEAPRCKFHGPMKKSNYGGWYCPSRMGDGQTYCDQKVAD